MSGKKLSVWGNGQTMNLPSIVHLNIQSSPYFKDLYRIKTYHEVLDEIYAKVEYLEPFIPGLVNVPSTAFCLLYKCFTLKLTENQIQGMLNHTDSPYIRGIGFLYLRFSTPPEQLFSWFSDFFNDEEEIYLRQKTGPSTVGVFVRQLLTEQRFCDVIIPRIPVPIQREIEKNLGQLFPAKKPEKEKKEASPPVAKQLSRSKSPKRQRSRSPKRQRSRSPRKRSKSPRRRSRSPRRRSKSPRIRSGSPRRRSRSPRRQPKRHSRSPKRRSRSPKTRSKSPKEEKQPILPPKISSPVESSKPKGLSFDALKAIYEKKKKKNEKKNK